MIPLMKHSRTVTGLVAALLVAGAAWADDASRMAKADELLRVTKADQTFRQMLDRAQAQLKLLAVRQAPSDADKAAIEQQAAPIAAEHLNWEKLRPQFVKAYADTYTEEEMDGIISFFKSPAGQAWISKVPEVNGRAVKISQEAMQEAQAQIRKLTEQAAPKEQ